MKQKSKKLILLFIISLVMILGLATIVNAADDEYKMEETSVNVLLNGTRYLNTINKPSGETEIWSSSDESVATVDSQGKVTGKSIGTATITAKAGTKTVTCTVNVEYTWANASTSFVTLVKDLYESKTINITAEDYGGNKITNPIVQWKSNDESVANVDSNGKITAVKAGSTKVIAMVPGRTIEIDVTVINAPIFTDFSNAKYETSFNGFYDDTLKITGIKPDDTHKSNYYYIITSNKNKPDIVYDENGSIDIENTKSELEDLSVNAKENYVYSRKIAKYEELNQDLYIWIIQENKLDQNYYDMQEKMISYVTKFVVEGKKLERIKLPQLNLILQGFNISGFTNLNGEKDDYTWIRFNFPTETKNRKFTLKIGIINDNTILSKIQKNDYSGIIELLAYAKKSDAIYNNNLTTTSEAYYANYNSALFDGKKILKNKAYYYIYAQFDDENGKYYPIEGVTLAQAYISSVSDFWDLWAYTSSDFKWDNLTSTYTSSPSIDAPTSLPYTGITAVGLAIVAMVGTAVFFKVKNNKYKGI